MSTKVHIVLCPEEHQIQLLLETMQRYNELCNYVSEIVFEQKDVKPINLYYWFIDNKSRNFYHHLKQEFPDINANFITLAFRKVSKAYKKRRPAQPHNFEGAIDYSNYLISIKFVLPAPDEIGMLTISTLVGRQKMHFTFDISDRETLRLAFSRKKYREFQLTYRKEQFCLVGELNESLVY